MRNRLVGAIAATAIAAAALVACSPPNENPSDIKVTDMENPTHSFEKGTETTSATSEETPADGTMQEPAVQQ